MFHVAHLVLLLSTMKMEKVASSRALRVALLVGLAGCSSDREGYVPEYQVGSLGANLTHTQSCGELLDGFQADGLAKIEMETANYLRWYVDEEEGQSYARGGDLDAGAAESAAPANDSSSKSAPENYSETNTQVEGVDEADIVKTDGTHIYVLNGSKLYVVKSWPAEETALQRGVDIEGYTHDMFVSDGVAVVFSSVGDPNFVPPADCPSEFDYQNYRYECYSNENFTKATIVEGLQSSPRVVRELYLEGHYRSSRRHESQVRAILNNWNSYYSWNLPQFWDYIQDIQDTYWRAETRSEALKDEMRARIFEWRDDAMAAMEATSLEDWTTRRYEKKDGVLYGFAPDCSGYFLNGPGLVDYGLTEVAGFDLARPEAQPSQDVIQGYAHEVYANAESMIITQWDYSSWYRAYLEDEDYMTTGTLVHRFELQSAARAQYQGSAAVEGTIADQFSIDETDGVLRLALTRTSWPLRWDEGLERRQDNAVVTLAPQGDRLVKLGSTPPLAPDESIQSARFLGDKAYVVTFRQVDPLFAIDLSDPTNPKVLGELKIPGFSTYMHPLDGDHLLTIGFDADEETGRRNGLALQIFNIADPTAPALKHKHVFEDDQWGYSEAAWNHKAFTFYDHLGMLAFPYMAYGSGWDDFRSSLEVFHVDPVSGFSKRGSVDHSNLVQSTCIGFEEEWQRQNCVYNYGQVRRGVFIEDFVYSISYGGIEVNRVENMAVDVARVNLPHDGITGYYYWGWGWWGVGGVAVEG